ILAAPVALVADPENLVDVSDQVDITWFNGAAYDNVELLRDGFLIATLGGSATSYTDNVNRGLYTYEVRGVLGGSTTSTASGRAFAGTINCNTEEEFESGTANLVLEGSWGLTSSIASVGTFSGHDSPSGDYANNLNISLEVVEPADLLSAATLTFDHICITEATFDFGYVEISTDFGSNWATLASYDMDDHAGWNDGTANPGDWISESLDISSYIGEVVRIRFRLETDAFVTEDGWYVDNIALSDSTCNATSSVPGDGLVPTMLRAAPNPFSGPLMLTLNLPEVTTGDIQVFNAAGRLVRTLHTGELLPGTSFVWDGANDNGRSTASGLYFIRAATKEGSLVRRVVKVD
ncbi:MAG: T9SS type A sorting domain-containing protein, partial [Candidatus Eisenbacteria bacterium]|nr:T9SS type A sorting domain-containing protein [Candidatus Eisenbacteria bacterium]